MSAGWTEKERLIVSQLDTFRTVPVVYPDMTWNIFIYSMECAASQLLSKVPALASTPTSVHNLLHLLDSACICEGRQMCIASESLHLESTHKNNVHVHYPKHIMCLLSS